jgi:putative ABC transport system permease protein
VEAATVGGGAPWEAGSGVVVVDGANRPAERTLVSMVDTAFLRMYGVRLLAGRLFVSEDAAADVDGPPVIVNRSFAADLLGEGNPIGRRVRFPDVGGEVNAWYTVVGVVDDFPANLADPRSPGVQRMLYRVALPGSWPGNLLTIQLRGRTPDAFAPTLRGIATSVDPGLQLTEVRSLDAVYHAQTRETTQMALVIALITGSVLLLSASGIHSLMTFTVNQRRREIGIRAALGAPGQRILSSVLARAARQLGGGIALGLVASVAMDVATGGSLMSGTELLLVPGTAAFMLVVGLLAAVGPARRGLRVQPTESLRTE